MNKNFLFNLYILSFLIALIAFSFKIIDSYNNIKYKREVELTEILGSFLLSFACLLKLPYLYQMNNKLLLLIIFIYFLGFLFTGIFNLIAKFQEKN